MYYPYFRGKQNELIVIRENAELIKSANFIPIIEPVKESVNPLKRALDAIIKVNGKAILIANPQYGDHHDNGNAIEELLANDYTNENIAIGLIASERSDITEMRAICQKFDGRDMAFIHTGFTDAKLLIDQLQISEGKHTHIFDEDFCVKLYRKHFEKSQRILLRDGFKRRKNREHPELEVFSDLHATYLEDRMNGFGDFLIVGDDYSESGGPAYAVAIHITFIDEEKDNLMLIHHFVSDRQDSPADPGGKFLEALDKLNVAVTQDDSKILRTAAIEEFLSLHQKKHFPGLGYVKKLSMQHHIETMANYFQNEAN